MHSQNFREVEGHGPVAADDAECVAALVSVSAVLLDAADWYTLCGEYGKISVRISPQACRVPPAGPEQQADVPEGVLVAVLGVDGLALFMEKMQSATRSCTSCCARR